MPRRLVLMRHAKSSWKSAAPSDRDRPLNKRGRRDAPEMGRRLVAAGWVPTLAVISDSQRTRETWALMADAFGDGVIERYTQSFYHAGLDAIAAEAARWPASAGTVLLLGHNPGWEDALRALTGRDTVLKTADAALLLGQGATWGEALVRTWVLQDILSPRERR